MLKSTTADAGRHYREGLYVIVASQYNVTYVDGMLLAVQRVMGESGVARRQLKTVRVPGVFEMPAVVSELASGTDREAVDAIIALGVVFQGETRHANHIVSAVTHAFATIQLTSRVPVVHEVLQLDSTEQAEERCMSVEFNRGEEAARTALAIASVMRSLRNDSSGVEPSRRRQVGDEPEHAG